MPPEPPSPPPSPPKNPPSPPQICIQETEGQTMPATTDATPDPVNEPCYSHSTCREYGGDGSGYVCCVRKGTCDNMVSNTQRYYQGGCRPLVTSGGTSTAANSSTSTNHPTKDEGCAKQG
jgi:hypothetical protein